ncbi:MAG TPA: branched-chain amino acid transaminase [Gemmatimonas aurantiaca]|uniref:Branched-chain-amino-acid aminotransferase n=2 Tax=Gemmatimonas aurantiaca TaxID=173480 RepID=C1AE53_GEMAT|nr:branched-chain amino acid transaminase [Gemmatimonas aurantiaca]BAH40780.1 branched-chain amino-acid aminotransferase [Gemmatimonas aurantiaca T-27]HCT59125.1 branched-chain amino acid transaminase [Gemmatimonas aurantiaca]
MSRISETQWIWRDGQFVPWADATIHVLSHSVQFGSSAFEGVRCYNTPKGPAIFRLREHLERLLHSCKIYRMDVKYTIDELIAASRELVVRNNVESCYIRPMVVRGYGTAGMVPIGSPIEVYLPCWPWGAYLGDEALDAGVDACVSSWQRVQPNTIPAMAKIAGNYLSGQLIKMEALANGYAEGIALSPSGMVGEGSGQNVFVVSNGTLLTGPLDGSILGGITRASIIQIAQDLGIPTKEFHIPREMLYMADEVFFTGTAAELTPVRSIDKIQIGAGKVGPITKQLQQQYLGIAKGTVEDRHGWLTHCK